VVTKSYLRNPDVIVEVLNRAGGFTDKTPYLEVHHKVQLAAGGEDVVENAIALCPNCHRREHFGPALWRTAP
jgi:5-methylcytosine-specific restriction protein A